MYYKRIDINGKDDLPKKAGTYFAGVKNNLNPEDVYQWFIYKNPIMNDTQAEYWENTFDWYLQPLPEQSGMPTDEDIEKLIDEYSMTTLATQDEIDKFKKSVLKFARWFKSRLAPSKEINCGKNW